jgi:hypothetical protein
MNKNIQIFFQLKFSITTLNIYPQKQEPAKMEQGNFSNTFQFIADGPQFFHNEDIQSCIPVTERPKKRERDTMMVDKHSDSAYNPEDENDDDDDEYEEDELSLEERISMRSNFFPDFSEQFEFDFIHCDVALVDYMKNPMNGLIEEKERFKISDSIIGYNELNQAFSFYDSQNVNSENSSPFLGFKVSEIMRLEIIEPNDAFAEGYVRVRLWFKSPRETTSEISYYLLIDSLEPRYLRKMVDIIWDIKKDFIRPTIFLDELYDSDSDSESDFEHEEEKESLTEKRESSNKETEQTFNFNFQKYE